ncbi:MAG: hypoxanthine phosphoribosyltransferase [Pseudomonadota bacterium]
MSELISSSMEVIFNENDISKRIHDLAGLISKNQKNDLLIIPILTGGFMFASDLMRALHKTGMSPEIDFLGLSSYHGQQTSSGAITISSNVRSEIKNRHVLIVDDILESGRTLNFAKTYFQQRQAETVQTCVLLNKRVQRTVPVEADFHAFECEDIFVVGYGMDLNYKLRELPYICKLKG